MAQRVILKESGEHTARSAASDKPERFDIAHTTGTGRDIKVEINLFAVARLLLRRRRLLATVVLGVMTITAIYLFLQPNLYTSEATILPTGKTTSSVSALKSLVGLAAALPASDENSSALFPVILRSNLIVDAVLARQYAFEHNRQLQTRTLREYFGQENPDRLRKNLRDVTSIRADKQTGEINVGVQTAYPELSRAVLAEYLTQLEDFNLNKRRSSAKSDAEYLQKQIIVVDADLHQAEDNLETFQRFNMDWANTTSPEILKELGRLQREVDVKSSTYTMLLNQLETAKLETQKDIPVVRILDEPSLPTVKSGPFRRNGIILSGFIALILSSLAIVVADIARQGTTGANRNDFASLQHDFQLTFPRTRKVVNRISAITARRHESASS